MSYDVPSGSITQAKRAPLGEQISASCGTFTTTSSPLVDVTNLHVTITTTGRMVMLALVPDGTASQAYIQGDNATVVAFVRGSTAVAVYQNLGAASNEAFPGMVGFDVPAAGTYTYKVQMGGSATDTKTMKLCKLVAFEL